MRIEKIHVHIQRVNIMRLLGVGDQAPLSEVLGGHPHPQFLHCTPLNWENSLMIAHKGAAVASMWLGNCFLHKTIPSPFSCMALLYNLAQLCDCFRTIFFCLVCRLTWKKSINYNSGSTWGRNCCTGTQNGSNLEIWPLGILIHALELKLRLFEVSRVCIGKPYIHSIFWPCATWGRGYMRTYVYICVMTLTKKLEEYMLPACIVWLYYSIY